MDARHRWLRLRQPRTVRRAVQLLICCGVCATYVAVAIAAGGGSRPRRIVQGRVLFNGARLQAWYLNQSARRSRVAEVRDPAGGRDHVLRFTTYNRDIAPLTPTRNPRSQLVTPMTILHAGHAFWESFEVYLPRSFPMARTNHGWLSLGTPFYGRPFAGTPSTGLSIVDGNFRWQANAHAPEPWQIFWQRPATVGRWIRFTWRIDPKPEGFAELYYDDRAVYASDYGRTWRGVVLPVVDATDRKGPWFSDLQVYYKHDQFPVVTLYFRGFRIAKTQAAAQAG